MLDITQWAEAAFQHFLRNPLAQRLPRKFKINFSGCATDCGQAMFNDVGVIAATPHADERRRSSAGFRVFIAGGLGANPHPALALEEFTAREDLLPTIEAILRVFDQAGNRENKLRARMKWLVDTLGFEEVQRRVLKIRHLLLGVVDRGRAASRQRSPKHGDAPAGVAADGEVTPVGQCVEDAHRCRSAASRRTSAGTEANVVRGVAKGTVSAYAWAALGDITSDQFRSLASIQRDLGAEVRLTNRQNLVFRGLTEEQLPPLFAPARRDRHGATRAPSSSRDVVACPGADTCNLAVTQCRGLADAIGDRARGGGPGRGRRRAHQHLRLHQLVRPAPRLRHRLLRRRASGANGRSAPGYQMLLGGYVGQEQIHFGEKALRLPAKNAPEAAVRVVRRFADEREAGETFRAWLDRSGGAATLGQSLKELDVFPTPEDNPDFYVDYGETGPYVAEIGASECAT